MQRVAELGFEPRHPGWLQSPPRFTASPALGDKPHPVPPRWDPEECGSSEGHEGPAPQELGRPSTRGAVTQAGGPLSSVPANVASRASGVTEFDSSNKGGVIRKR